MQRNTDKKWKTGMLKKDEKQKRPIITLLQKDKGKKINSVWRKDDDNKNKQLGDGKTLNPHAEQITLLMNKITEDMEMTTTVHIQDTQNKHGNNRVLQHPQGKAEAMKSTNKRGQHPWLKDSGVQHIASCH
ncbi:hypothetical protein CgunFtcFv8_009210 [Champsocephalus gunnari]|uniref:Uncharacterized protein n=1 Tax=Champsocephalus gunnari TaxID=52237 RepID=A0AAN8GYE4_CHAGU|nr:hypothetical protein CgunFtcFv8_009210 [Champsocephalus gunnari]